METEQSQRPGRILVVDQDAWCRDFLTQVIKLLGVAEYHLATTVEEAQQALGETSFDLVITDHKLPDHRRLLDDCRQRFPAMRFIIMMHQRTHTTHFSYQERVDIVVKPLSLDEMARKIREAIHQIHRHQVEEEFRRLRQEVLRVLG